MTKKPHVKLPGTVEKIIKTAHADGPEKAQIAIEGADDFYKEIRIKNTLTAMNGQKVGLKRGADVEVTVEADPKATEPKKATRK